jgi:hypothetical protein
MKASEYKKKRYEYQWLHADKMQSRAENTTGCNYSLGMLIDAMIDIDGYRRVIIRKFEFDEWKLVYVGF